MLYAIQVLAAQERKVVNMSMKMLDPTVLQRCYLPYRKMLKKYGGTRRVVEEILFPGYVFIETDNPLELYLQLKRVPKLTKMLYDYSPEATFFIDLQEQDIRFMHHIIQNGYLHISKVDITSSQEIEIVEGPLLELADQITDFNLHQRYVNVHMNFLNREADVHFGIAILGKDEQFLSNDG